jgi:pyruvate formate lyase activating enzyme
MNEPRSENDIRGIVFDIQRGAMHDGPGIRTTVFLKGCPLRCAWCHNPESWTLQPQEAESVTPGQAPTILGQSRQVGEIMDIVRKDRAYYERSGGGLTISGGEPTLQFQFCKALLQAARSENIHTCLDTCGCNRTGIFLDLLPWVDLFLWDYKATGELLHQKLTGSSCELIRENFELLYQRGASILIRAPLIPQVNDTPEHLEALSAFARDYTKLRGIEVLPYHDTGLSKFERLGIPRRALQTTVPSPAIKARWKAGLHPQIIIKD